MPYKAKNGGSTTGKSGRHYRFNMGQTVYAPKGELDHCNSVEWVEPEPPSVETVHPKPLDGTVKQIKKWLDAREVDYPSNALKDELLEILEDA